MNYILCPKCGSDEIFQTIEGHLECEHCGFRFNRDPQKSSQSEQLTELKRQSTLLRKVISLLKRCYRIISRIELSR
ncbi:MAG: hypothetical protein QXT73_03010 [Candidatus Methanomethylicaceae archaeon]